MHPSLWAHAGPSDLYQFLGHRDEFDPSPTLTPRSRLQRLSLLWKGFLQDGVRQWDLMFIQPKEHMRGQALMLNQRARLEICIPNSSQRCEAGLRSALLRRPVEFFRAELVRPCHCALVGEGAQNDHVENCSFWVGIRFASLIYADIFSNVSISVQFGLLFNSFR